MQQLAGRQRHGSITSTTLAEGEHTRRFEHGRGGEGRDSAERRLRIVEDPRIDQPD